MGEPNNLLREARLRRPSQTGPDRPMSRQEAAEALNSMLFSQTGKEHTLDANYFGKLERGLIRWPQAKYRKALRGVFDAATDAEPGLYRFRVLGGTPRAAPEAGNARSLDNAEGA